VKINGVRWRERQKRARQSFPVMGFGLCLREQRGSSHVSCAEGRASRAVNAAEVEGSVIPRLLAILTAFSPSLPFSFLSLVESRKSSQKSLWILHPTAGMLFNARCHLISLRAGLKKNRCRKVLTFSTDCWSFLTAFKLMDSLRTDVAFCSSASKG